MIGEVTIIELDDGFYVDIKIEDQRVRRVGPFPEWDGAHEAAEDLIAMLAFTRAQ